MIEDEEDPEVSRPTLEGVAEVVLVFVVLEVALAACRVVEAEDAVERDCEPEGDFDEEQVRDLGVDPGDLVSKVLDAPFADAHAFALMASLEREPSPREGGVGHKVGDQEDSDREDAGQ